ncbi:hypothetical protein [Micromonospora chersina]
MQRLRAHQRATGYNQTGVVCMRRKGVTERAQWCGGRRGSRGRPVSVLDLLTSLVVHHGRLGAAP